MSLNFPNSPTVNQIFTDPTSGISYLWNGSRWTTIGIGLNYVAKTGDFISGPLLFSDGTAVAPGISFSSSTGSGFYRNADGIGLSISTVPVQFVSALNRVGINTTSPEAELDVRTSGSNSTLRVQSSTGNRFRFISESTGSNKIYSESSTGTAAGLSIFSGATETVVLDTSSRVGIGGSPNFKLDVISSSGVNTIRSFSSSATDARFIAKTNSNETIFGSDSFGSYITQVSNLPFRVITNNTENLRLLSDGSLGIKTDGTTDAKLHVSGTKNSNIFHAEAGSNNYDGIYLQAETLSGQSGGVKWIPNNTPGSGTLEFTSHFANNTSGGTVRHNLRVGGNLTVEGSLNGTGVSTSIVTSNTSMLNNGRYLIYANSTVTLTLPSSPTTGTAIKIMNATSINTHIIARNGSTIMGLSEDMIINQIGIEFLIWFDGTTWRLF